MAEGKLAKLGFFSVEHYLLENNTLEKFVNNKMQDFSKLISTEEITYLTLTTNRNS